LAKQSNTMSEKMSENPGSMAEPTLCKMGCGFFVSVATVWMLAAGTRGGSKGGKGGDRCVAIGIIDTRSRLDSSTDSYVT